MLTAHLVFVHMRKESYDTKKRHHLDAVTQIMTGFFCAHPKVASKNIIHPEKYLLVRPCVPYAFNARTRIAFSSYFIESNAVSAALNLYEP